LTPELSIDLTGFYTHYNALRTAAPSAPVVISVAQPYLLFPYVYTNFATGHSEGQEVAITYHPVSRWKIAASYSYLDVHQSLTAAAPEGTQTTGGSASPAHQVKVQSYWNVSKSVELDTHVFYGSAFLGPYLVTAAMIPSHLRVDVRLGWRIKPRWEVSVVGQDLGSRRLLELTPEAFGSPTYTGRGFYVKSTWRF